MDTLRSGFRFLHATFVNSEVVYSLLMGMGWVFLMGWAVSLIVACASVFRHERPGALNSALGFKHSRVKGRKKIAG
jgi:hypothetical protein